MDVKYLDINSMTLNTFLNDLQPVRGKGRITDLKLSVPQAQLELSDLIQGAEMNYNRFDTAAVSIWGMETPVRPPVVVSVNKDNHP